MRKLKESTIEITQKCKSNCLFCSSLSGINKTIEIPTKNIFKILSFCKDKGVERINISGGEPLLYEGLIDILNYAEQIGVGLNVYTSGNVEDHSIFNRILKINRHKNQVKFIFNYPSIHNDIFQTLINDNSTNIDDINYAIRLLITNSIGVETHIVPNEINLHSLFETTERLKQLGVEQVSFLRMVFQGRAEKNKRVLEIKDIKALSGVIEKIKRNLCDNSFKLRVGIPFSNLTMEKCECFAGINKLIFRYDGAVFPCEAFKEAPENEKYKLGNVYTNELNTIWNNHPVHKRLRLLKDRAFKTNETCPAQLLYT